MGHPDSLNERRIVTILSVDIVESTKLVAGLDPDDAMDLLDRSFLVVQEAISNAGGSVMSFNGDGALAIFGWPAPIEHHADNACCAAWDIQKTRFLVRDSDDKNVNSVWYRVGVHSGLVALRKTKLTLSSRIDAIGECVHIATHMQKCASVGEVLISQNTVDLCRRILSIERECKSDVAVSDPPIKAYRLLDRPRQLSISDFVRRHSVESYGRDEEIVFLSHLADPPAGKPIAHAIIGDPGIGKSHIASVIASHAAANGLKTFLIEGSDFESASPFSAARRLIRNALGDKFCDVEDALVENGVERREAKVLATVLKSQSVTQSQFFNTKPVAMIANSMAGAISKILSHHSCLLIIEDLHNIDPDSCRIFELVARGATDTALAILATGRPEARGVANRITRSILELASIKDGAMCDLLRARTSGRTFSRLQIDRIVECADGNPFILEQLIQNIDDAVPNISELLPQSVEALIHARLDKISSPARLLAQKLSLLGDRIDLTFANAVTGGDLRGDDPEFLELADNGIIYPPRDGQVRFRHALVAAACETTVRKADRCQLHIAAIETIKSRNQELCDWHAVMAHHAIRAGKDAEALEYLSQAARLARSLAAGRSLLRLFEQAMACCDRLGNAGDERFVEFVLLAFETFQLQGEINRIAPYLSRAIEFLKNRSRNKDQCIAKCHLGFTHWYNGEYKIGAALMRSTLQEAKQLNHLPLRFAAQLMLAHHLHALSQIDEAFELARELCGTLSGELELKRLGAVGLPACLANAFAGYYIIDKGEYEAAEQLSLKALKIAERGEDIYSQVLARLGLGRVLIRMHRYQEAVDCLTVNQEFIESFGFDTSRPNNLGLLCTAMSRIGRAADAVDIVLKRLDRDLVERTGRLERHYFGVGYGEALIAAGRLEEGMAEIDDAVRIGRAKENMGLLIQSIGLKAAILETVSPDHEKIGHLRSEEKRIANTHGLVGLELTTLNWA